MKLLTEISRPTRELCAYMATALKKPLPKPVVEKAKHHILDTIAAVVSGSALKPGKQTLKYVSTLGGTPEAGIAGSRIVTTAVNAALANGIFAHADETDDTHPESFIHPGCGIVPAALAAGEKAHASGRDFLRAVVLGYDVACRMTKALDVDAFSDAHRSTHSFGGLFGAGAAAGALFKLDAVEAQHLLSFLAQLASGCKSTTRDHEHMEKAFVFGGKTAQSGVQAAAMVASGFTGVDDVFSGPRNFLMAYAPKPHPGELSRALGKRYEILGTDIKKWCVGSPNQAVLDSVYALMTENDLVPDEIARIDVMIPSGSVGTVDEAPAPDINCQHLVALMLVDGGLGFGPSHDYKRLKDKRIVALKKRIRLIGVKKLETAMPPRQAAVEIRCRDGRKLHRHTKGVRGTTYNPMTREELTAKARELMDPILGRAKSRKLVETVFDIERVKDLTRLRPLLSATPK
jgi:2-methylcitrate dehydratase PrpD